MKVTKKHFELFKSECLKWQRKLGLTNYELFFKHEYIDGGMASCAVGTLENYNATLCISTKFDGFKNIKYNIEEQIKKCAFHEMCHVLLDRLTQVGEARYINESEIREAEHEIVRRLEFLINNDN